MQAPLLADLFTIEESRSQILRLRRKIKICSLGMRLRSCAPEITRPRKVFFQLKKRLRSKRSKSTLTHKLFE